MPVTLEALRPSDDFAPRHLGPSPAERTQMLERLGFADMDSLCDAAVPEVIRRRAPLDLPAALGEQAALVRIRELASQNQVFRTHIGMGYYDCLTPPVILRNVLENPGWYTQYTPYQAEISQGRLEALLNFQTMVADLTGLPLANASLLDEPTAAAEAMHMCRSIQRGRRDRFLVDQACHPQTIALLRARAEPVGVKLEVGDATSPSAVGPDLIGALVQYPDTNGDIREFEALAEALHKEGALLVVATDLLALTLLRPPGEFGADIALGSAQRFGVPMGYGGPHAAFLATADKYKRQMPGRIVGVSRDARGNLAYRLAIQTREQHIRRDKATSNICTAQVLLAIMASMYGVYHGSRGLLRIARRVQGLTGLLRVGLSQLGLDTGTAPLFDTLRVRLTPDRGRELLAAAAQRGINLRSFEGGDLGISLDETTTLAHVQELLSLFGWEGSGPELSALLPKVTEGAPEPFARKSDFMTHPVFSAHQVEHELLRYIHRLQAKDLSLTTSMIPLGSCTMKLNATAEMLPVTWAEFGRMHPFAPRRQAAGYAALFSDLERWLAEITGFAAISLQPNAGSQGEYAGLMCIRAYHHARGDRGRDVCLIPKSAHGTNPASAVIAGFRVVVVGCDDDGNIDVDDLRAKADKHSEELGALMITYPSTHGVFEVGIKDICSIVHDNGGQVYMDGANMNAQVGLCRPGDIGADVCHLNLHKTFAIPHGGGGPGMGPIGVAAHLAPFLPGHPVSGGGGAQAIGPISAAAWGSASILPISWMYIAMLGAEGATDATRVAILNANYMAARLKGHFDVLYTGASGLVAHEFVLDARPFKVSAGVEVEDIAKRLMDFGFHAPTMSWPVAGTLMVEPTESESKAELDRLCDALIAIRAEIREIEEGRADRADNALKHAPHTAQVVSASAWPHAYSREQAAYPAPWAKGYKYWPPVSRIDNTYGDRHLMCLCPSPEAFEGPQD
ncbi:MAG: aminomethyl-transferring glycine dehydrogenase [Myxococcales bacterium]|nr:aminomethyl-transferring glycine dehydrogenase [Myxococcales bacterium]